MDLFQLIQFKLLYAHTQTSQINGLTVLWSDRMKKKMKMTPNVRTGILAEANSAAGAEAKNRFSRTECVLIQQLYNHGTSNITGKH